MSRGDRSINETKSAQVQGTALIRFTWLLLPKVWQVFILTVVPCECHNLLLFWKIFCVFCLLLFCVKHLPLTPRHFDVVCLLLPTPSLRISLCQETFSVPSSFCSCHPFQPTVFAELNSISLSLTEALLSLESSFCCRHLWWLAPMKQSLQMSSLGHWIKIFE